MVLRLVQALQGDGRREDAVRLLRGLVDSQGSRTEPGIALRIARVAADLDPGLGFRAANGVLEQPGVAPAEREAAERLKRACGGVPLPGE